MRPVPKSRHSAWNRIRAPAPATRRTAVGSWRYSRHHHWGSRSAEPLRQPGLNAQPAPEIDPITWRNKSGTMFGEDHWRRIAYCVANRKQYGKFFEGERFRFGGHDSSMSQFGNFECSILLRSTYCRPPNVADTNERRRQPAAFTLASLVHWKKYACRSRPHFVGGPLS
jgi:hypothetical protein